MSLIRKVRKVGSSLVVTIPMQLADFYKISGGTQVEFSSGSGETIVLKKVI